MYPKVQALIDRWAAQKYPEVPAGATFILDMGGGDDGYCETCSSPYEAVFVYAIVDGKPWPEKKKGRTGRTDYPSDARLKYNQLEVGEIRDVQLHELLNEILEAAL
jgi:hypothetical protein